MRQRCKDFFTSIVYEGLIDQLKRGQHLYGNFLPKLPKATVTVDVVVYFNDQVSDVHDYIEVSSCYTSSEEALVRCA